MCLTFIGFSRILIVYNKREKKNMIRKAMTNSTIDSLDKTDLLGNLHLFLSDEIERELVAPILESAFGVDSKLSFDSLVDRLWAIPFDSSLNAKVGTVLFFLSTELPEHGC